MHRKRSDRKLHTSHCVEMNCVRFEYLLNEKFNVVGIHRLKDLPVLGEDCGDEGTILHI